MEMGSACREKFRTRRQCIARILVLEQTKNSEVGSRLGLASGFASNRRGLSAMSAGVESSGCVNKVILLGNLGRDPEVRELASGERWSVCGSPPTRAGVTRKQANGGNGPSGIASPFSMPRLAALPGNICGRARKSMSLAGCARGLGRTRAAQTATGPKWSSTAPIANSRCCPAGGVLARTARRRDRLKADGGRLAGAGHCGKQRLGLLARGSGLG